MKILKLEVPLNNGYHQAIARSLETASPNKITWNMAM